MQISGDKRQRVSPPSQPESPRHHPSTTGYAAADYSSHYSTIPASASASPHGMTAAAHAASVVVATAAAAAAAISPPAAALAAGLGLGVDPSTLPDCNRCRFCLDKKRNGGTGTLRRRCVLKGEPERKRTTLGGGAPSAPGAPRKVSVPPNLASATADPHLNGTVVKYLAALHTCDAASFEAVWHPEGQLLGLAADGGLLLLDADEYKEAVAGRAPSLSEAYTQHDRVLSLTVHDGRTATAKVRLALPASAASPAAPATPAALHTELLVLLRDDVCGWRIISKLQAASDLSEPAAGPAAVGAADFGAAAAAAGGYLEAARACSAPRLSALVHELGRLTYASAEGRVQVLTLTLTLPLRPTLTLTPNPCP